MNRSDVEDVVIQFVEERGTAEAAEVIRTIRTNSEFSESEISSAIYRLVDRGDLHPDLDLRLEITNSARTQG